MSERVSVLLGRLARRFGLVACVSGRSAADARRLVGVGGIAYAGSHGAELLEPGAEPAANRRGLQELGGRVQALRRGARHAGAAPAAGADRGQGPDRCVPLARRARRGRRARPGSRSSPARPSGRVSRSTGAARCSRCGRRSRFDKGRAVRALVEARVGRAPPCSRGDDATDLDAFDALDGARRTRARSRRAVRVGRPLGRGAGGDRRARRPRGRRRGGLHARARGARRRCEVPRLPARRRCCSSAAPRRRSPSSRWSGAGDEDDEHARLRGRGLVVRRHARRPLARAPAGRHAGIARLLADARAPTPCRSSSPAP